MLPSSIVNGPVAHYNPRISYAGTDNNKEQFTEVKMAIERTFSIIKPNAVAKNVIGNIFARFDAAGFKIIGTEMLHLTVEQARGAFMLNTMENRSLMVWLNS